MSATPVLGTIPKSPAAVERLDLSFTCLQLHPAGRALAPCVLTAINTAEEERGFRSLLEVGPQAAKTAASAVSIRAKKKRTHHGGLVLPLVMSIGGGIFADADALVLPRTPPRARTGLTCVTSISCTLFCIFTAVKS